MPINRDILINKAQTIERCVARAREEYAVDPSSFSSNHTHQDAAILNIQRACEASLDIAQHIISNENLGVAQSARDGFVLLAKNSIITQALCTQMQAMQGFRNIAVHDYQSLHTNIVERVILTSLDNVLQFSATILKHYA
jgi:uncharacterized protein YutE (UPF0331/DUF86 family)